MTENTAICSRSTSKQESTLSSSVPTLLHWACSHSRSYGQQRPVGDIFTRICLSELSISACFLHSVRLERLWGFH